MWLSVSPAGSAPGQETHIHSQQIDQLAASLCDYVRGTGTGHSYLISGHRGAGKTTLVRVVIDTVQQTLPSADRVPLIISLSGPSLFADPPLDDSGEPLLRAHVLNCYRLTEALTLGVQRAFRQRMQARAARDDQKQQTLALLQHRLDGSSVSLADLVTVWRELVGDGEALWGRQDRYAEVQALYTTVRLYQITAGTPAASYTQKTQDADTQKQGLTLSQTLTELAPLLVGVLTGGLAGAGLTLAADNLTALIGSLLAALLAGLTADATIRRDWTDTVDTSYSYNPDFSVNSLPRMLPALVEQLWEVGLAPIFVVDELDKVVDLPAKMKALLDHLKSFVTEQSAFFFLVDRAYFETVRRISQARAYPIEYTYFNTRLYVNYQPIELRRYLDLVLSHSGATVAWDAQRMVSDVMLYRARLHFFSLRQQLQKLKLRSDSGLLPAPGKLVQEPEWCYPFVFQCAVELSLQSAALQRRQKDDSYFTQLAVDVLYYPAYFWDEGLPLRLDEPALRAWLEQRLQGDDADQRALLGASDFALLLRELRAVIGYLLAPETLRARLESTPAPQVLLENADAKVRPDRTMARDRWQRWQVFARIPRALPAPLLRDDGDEDVYTWYCTPFGRPLEPADAPKLSVLLAAMASWPEHDVDAGFGLLAGAALLQGDDPVLLARCRSYADGVPPANEQQLGELYTLRRRLKRSSPHLIAVLLWTAALCAQQLPQSPRLRQRTLAILHQVSAETRQRGGTLLTLAGLGEMLHALYPEREWAAPLAPLLLPAPTIGWAALPAAMAALAEAPLALDPQERALQLARGRRAWTERLEAWRSGTERAAAAAPTYLDLLARLYIEPEAPYRFQDPATIPTDAWVQLRADLEPFCSDDPAAAALDRTIAGILEVLGQEGHEEAG